MENQDWDDEEYDDDDDEDYKLEFIEFEIILEDMFETEWGVEYITAYQSGYIKVRNGLFDTTIGMLNKN